jgi:thioesterase domain-containing protein/acyl carrier protein
MVARPRPQADFPASASRDASGRTALPGRLAASGKVDLITLQQIDHDNLASLTSERSRDGTAASEPTTRSAVSGAVRAAWIRLLGEDSFAANTTWEQAGGDSLKAMELLLSIEGALGRAVAAEVFTPEISPSAMIDAIAERFEAAPHPSATDGGTALASSDKTRWPLSHDLRVRLLASLAAWPGSRPTGSRMVIGHNMPGKKPPIFWVLNTEDEPGQLASVLGHDQPLYAFRSGLRICDCSEDEIQAIALRYIAEIEELYPQGPVFIAGHCQGADFALAIAQHALRRKRHVPLLILTDSTSELQPYAGRAILISGKGDIRRNPRLRFSRPELAWHRTFAEFEFVEIAGSYSLDETSLDELGRILTSRMELALSAAVAAMPSSAYRATISATGIGSQMRTGQRRTCQVTVRNNGDLTWRGTESSGLLIGSRWTDRDGDLILTGESRSEVPVMEPGSCSSVDLEISAPSAAGEYQLHIDVSEEGNRWFNADPTRASTTPISVCPSSSSRLPRFLSQIRGSKRRSQLYYFDDASKTQNLLLFGWSAPERWGSWTIGSRAKLLLPLNGRNGPWRVIITSKAFGRADSTVLVEARVGNNTENLKWRMPANAETRNPIDIDCDGDDIILGLTMPEAISPHELGQGPDHRKLGLGLVAMEFIKLPR